MPEIIRDNVITCRIWATHAGQFVLDGHRDAAFLRYGPGDQVHPEDRAKLDDLASRETGIGAKEAPPVADKQARTPANKSGSGLTVNRLPRGEGRP